MQYNECNIYASSMQPLGGQRFFTMYMGAGLVSSACFAFWPYVAPRSWPSTGRSSQVCPFHIIEPL